MKKIYLQNNPTVKNKIMKSFPLILLCGFFFLTGTNVYSQNSAKTDSVIQTIINDKLNLDDNGQGVSLIKDEKYSEANSFLTNEINKNDLNREAYFNRGVARWELNQPEEACRDWSAVLALGDTATFLLLDSKCGGSMILEKDTLSSKQYRKIFAQKKTDDQTGGDSKVQNIADQMPEFPGGTEALYNYLKSNLKYPDKARKAKTEGRVYVNFVVSRTGKVLYPYVERGIGHGCNEEAVRLVKNMPPWKPGKQKGKPVLVRYIIPVSFRL